MTIALPLAMLCGCGGPPATVEIPIDPPPDLTVDVTVLSGDDEAPLKPAHLRTSRYVLFPDGALHSGSAPSLTADDFPPYTRTLSTAQREAIWRVIVDSGLADPAMADQVGNVELVQAAPGQMTHVIAISADGRRWTMGRTRNLADPPDPSMTRFVRSLAALAWASDAPDLEHLTVPKRYDFGPDPYEQYRRPAPDGADETEESDS